MARSQPYMAHYTSSRDGDFAMRLSLEACGTVYQTDTCEALVKVGVPPRIEDLFDSQNESNVNYPTAKNKKTNQPIENQRKINRPLSTA